MVNNIRLVQILVILIAVLILLRLISAQVSFNTEAQQKTAVSPSFSCLGPCPSVSAAPSGSSNGTSIAPSGASVPSILPVTSSTTQPCSGHSVLHKGWSKALGGKKSGGFLSDIFKFLMMLIDVLLKSFGAGGVGGNSQPQLSQPQPSQPSQPPQPTQPSQPCNPSTAGGPAPSGPAISSVASTVPSGTTTSSGSATTTAGGLTDQNACGNQGQGAGVRPVTPKCTVNATDINGASAAKSGDTVCFKGNLTGRLQADKPGVIYSGDGTTTVNGIDATGEGATVQGFVVQNVTAAPGIKATGKNITIADNTVKGPTKGGDDDGMRFFGDGLKILHNTITDIAPESQQHSDCMQTFATSTPTTSNTIVDSNYCKNIANICWIIEGPHSTAGNGSGQGQSANDVFINNYCNGNASDGVFTDDVQGFKFINNDMEGNNKSAIVFTGSQGDNITKCTKLGPGTPKEIGIDAPRNGSHNPK
ncbi:MAG: hypothetical protein ACR2LN_00080 [Candidatus Levyibacteriota bacterium]